MGFILFGAAAVLAGLLGVLIHVLSERMKFARHSPRNSLLASVLCVLVCLGAIILERGLTPESLSVWFHQNPGKAMALTRFIEAPLAFLVSLPVFWAVYREPLSRLAKLALVPLVIFFIL